MADRDVKPTDDGWQVLKKGAQRASAKAPTQVEAVARATEIVSNDGGGKVVVYGTDGKVRESQTVQAGADTATEAPKNAAKATAAGARATGKAAADKAGKTAQAVSSDAKATGEKVADRAETSAKKATAQAKAGAEGIADEAKAATNGKSVKAAAEDAATIAQTSGGQVAETTSRAGERIAKDTARAGKRAGQTVGAAAEEAGDKAVEGGDRAARVSQGVDRELNTVGDDLAGNITSVTEAQARKVDAAVEEATRQANAAAPSYNPVRIAGQVAGFAVPTAFSVTGAVVSAGGALLSGAARKATGRR